MPEAKPITSSGPYSNSGDFRRIFSEEIDSLYVLSLLLTAEPEKAKQCFVSGLEDSVNGKPVFKECAHSWARRAIIQNAVPVIKPRPMVEIAPSNSDSGKTTPAGQAEIAVVLQLEPFDRFVYAMSVLEGYSDEDLVGSPGLRVTGRDHSPTTWAAANQSAPKFHLKRQIMSARDVGLHDYYGSVLEL
jgi:hypothetical protein